MHFWKLLQPYFKSNHSSQIKCVLTTRKIPRHYFMVNTLSHSVEIAANHFNHFFAKIPWNQHNKLNYVLFSRNSFLVIVKFSNFHTLCLSYLMIHESWHKGVKFMTHTYFPLGQEFPFLCLSTKATTVFEHYINGFLKVVNCENFWSYWMLQFTNFSGTLMLRIAKSCRHFDNFLEVLNSKIGKTSVLKNCTNSLNHNSESLKL